jgi:hypothetical protein
MRRRGTQNYRFSNGENRRGFTTNPATMKRVTCLNDGKEFGSLKEASEFYGVHVSGISKSIVREIPIKGLSFDYAK